MGKQITITVNNFIVDKIIGDVKNKSARAEELLLKGWSVERDEEMNRKIEESPLFQSLTKNLKDYI